MEKIGIVHTVKKSTSEFDYHHLKIMFHEETNLIFLRLQNTTKIPKFYSFFSQNLKFCCLSFSLISVQYNRRTISDHSQEQK
jgi:hypothetical protein